jgi:putative nucleotidyltransferase with HDIG domain
LEFRRAGLTQGQERHVRAEARLDETNPVPQVAQILVVDGGAQSRTQMASVLEIEGYGVRLASSGHHALELLEGESVDLVLTDMMMLDSSGLDLLERIRRQYPELPVVMVTALNSLSVAVDAMRRGACDYLVKPLEGEQLLDAVARALDRRHALQESHHYRQNLEEAVARRTEMLRLAVEDLEHSYDVTLEALGDALDLKDAETEGHSKRVTAYTIALARAMGISAEEIKVIARGAFLHDVGKMAIPDHILLKPSKLNAEEQEIMRQHCALGFRMLRKIPFLEEATQIVYSHQEHYDGSGYPRQLRGTEIPIGARIFAIADTLDAITCDRPYRKAQSFDAARKEIQRCSGSQFDPGIVAIFTQIPNELWYELRNEITSQNRLFSPFDLSEGAPVPAGK